MPEPYRRPRRESGSAPQPPQPEADRVGEFVRQLLPRELKRLGVGWPCEAAWNARCIRARIIRGDLSLVVEADRGGRGHTPTPSGRMRFVDGREWYLPCTREWAAELAGVTAGRLARLCEGFRDTDETGRHHITLWREPDREARWRLSPIEGVEPTRLVLEPGWRLDVTEREIRHYRYGTGRLHEMLMHGEARIED